MSRETEAGPSEHARLILEGSGWSVLGRLALPAVVGFALTGLNQVVDALVVAWVVGEEAVAAISLAFPLAYLALGLGTLVGAGASTVLGMAIGARDGQRQRQVVGNMVLLALALGLPLTLTSVLLAEPMLRLLGGTGDALRLAIDYFQVLALGTVATALGVGGNQLVRGEGKMTTAMLMSGFATTVNMLLSPLLAGVLGWGVVGAAVATDLAMALYAVTAWIHYARGGATFAVDLRRWRLDRAIVADMLRLGAPSLVLLAMNLLQQLVVIRVVSDRGTMRDVAFFGVAYRLVMLLSYPMLGLMRALQSVVAINYGARQIDRIRTLFWSFTFTGTAALTLPWAVAVAVPDALLVPLLGGEAVQPPERLGFRIYLTAALLYPLILNGLALLASTNRPRPAVLVGLGRQVFVFIPAVLVLAATFGIPGIYYGLAGVEALVATVALGVVVVHLRTLGFDRGKE